MIAFCGMSHQLGFNQNPGGDLWGSRVKRCNSLVQARAELYMVQHQGFTYEAARHAVRQMPVAALAPYDLDLIQWSKEIGESLMGKLISAGCIWAGQRAWCLIDETTGAPIKIVSHGTKGAELVSDHAVFGLKGERAWCLLDATTGAPIKIVSRETKGAVLVSDHAVYRLRSERAVKTAWCKIDAGGTPIALGKKGDPGVHRITHDAVLALKGKRGGDTKMGEGKDGTTVS